MKTFVGLRHNKQFTKRNGRAQLYLLVGLEGKFERYPLNLEWPPHLVDEDANRLKPRTKEDKDADDLNLIVAVEVGKFTEVFRMHRLSGQALSMEALLKAVRNYSDRGDFLAWMLALIGEREKARDIGYDTARHYRCTVNWLKRYKKKVSFQDITPDFVKGFQTFQKKEPGMRMAQSVKQNTLVRNLRTLRIYILEAFRQGLIAENPFPKLRGKLKMTQEFGDREFLLPVEVQQFERFLPKSHSLPRKMVLLEFLISTRTGLRLSDLKKKLTAPLVERYCYDASMAFKPLKTANTSGKVVKLPLGEETMGWMRELVRVRDEMKKARLTMSEQNGRDFLKESATKLFIQKKVTYHVARHTFATNYLRSGGRLENLRVLLGHTNINTTMVYVHCAQQDIEDEMARLDAFYQQLVA